MSNASTGRHKAKSTHRKMCWEAERRGEPLACPPLISRGKGASKPTVSSLSLPALRMEPKQKHELIRLDLCDKTTQAT